jgi:hypothetical protein
MLDSAWNVLLNVVASAITGVAVWLGQRALWRRRLERKRRFYGLRPGEDCVLVVNRHHSSPRDSSVNRTDVSALLLLAGVLAECGARPRVLFHDQPSDDLGERTEFCLGGPSSNVRTVAHLRQRLPGVSMPERDPEGPVIRVAADVFRVERDVAVHVLLAKLPGRGRSGPVFVISGLTALANQAAVGYLTARWRELARAHGLDGAFCLVLRVVEPAVYGPSLVELVLDATATAFARPAAVPTPST